MPRRDFRNERAADIGIRKGNGKGNGLAAATGTAT
jgi:hypothetical protein